MALDGAYMVVLILRNLCKEHKGDCFKCTGQAVIKRKGKEWNIGECLVKEDA